jgi:hypothetical protein
VVRSSPPPLQSARRFTGLQEHGWWTFFIVWKLETP